MAHVNEQAEGLHIHIAVERDADNKTWCEWLTTNLGFRMPRVARVARDIAPSAFADALRGGRPKLRHSERTAWPCSTRTKSTRR